MFCFLKYELYLKMQTIDKCKIPSSILLSHALYIQIRQGILMNLKREFIKLKLKKFFFFDLLQKRHGNIS